MLHTADWIVLISTLLFIVIYGIYKSRGSKNIDSYLRGNSLPWYMVGLSIMATQASAITFLSAPGQAFTDGMRFIQFYFGLPLAMIVLSITVVPIYHRLKVYTAYEYLETRFDLKTRTFAAILFLAGRGLAAGLTIYGPAIVLSSILHWDIYLTNLLVGLLVIVYTVSGGTKAVSYTQLGQMIVILAGMFVAGYLIVDNLPEGIGFNQAITLAGKSGKMNIIDWKFDLSNKYSVWSGLIGGFFLAMSYFGTDQSQVSRYLGGKSVTQSRIGLLMNGIVKIPMQFFILLIGILLFTFFQFQPQPLFYNQVEISDLKNSSKAAEYETIEKQYRNLEIEKKSESIKIIEQNADPNRFKQLLKEEEKFRDQTKVLIQQNKPNLYKSAKEVQDINYIFLYFVTNYLPIGLIGLLIAVILSASMSSTSSELNALAGTTVVDIIKRSFAKNKSDRYYLNASRLATFVWGIYAILVAMLANKLGSLIEAVNQLGSHFYGTILGMFVVAFYIKEVKGGGVFYAALIAQATLFVVSYFGLMEYLWLNVLGCAIVVIISWLQYHLSFNRVFE
jgi:Na+/proline symporter